MNEKGLKHRSKRPVEVEAVFGQLKSNNKFNRFTFKGLEKVEIEFLLMSIGHNFRKMIANKICFSPKLIEKSPLKSQNTFMKIYNHAFETKIQKKGKVIQVDFQNLKIAG